MPLLPGSLAPSFRAAGIHNPSYAFDSVAGRNIVMLFVHEPRDPVTSALIEASRLHRNLFDDEFASLFVFAPDRQALQALGVTESYPGLRCLFDPDHRIARMFRLVDESGALVAPSMVVLDRHLRIVMTLAGVDAVSQFAASMLVLGRLHAWRGMQRSLGHAPILVADRIFDLELCRRLIADFELQGGKRSGFMRDIAGMTKGVLSDDHKRRDDCEIKDEELLKTVHSMLVHRLKPLVRQAFNFDASRIERNIVGRYSAAERGFFRPHRDNTTLATAHRRFAVTINLNAEDFEGGELRFPEFSDATYRAPTGGAVVFSCSLLHEATPVTGGDRYAFLPFLYGEAEAQVRVEGRKFLEGE